MVCLSRRQRPQIFLGICFRVTKRTSQVCPRIWSWKSFTPNLRVAWFMPLYGGVRLVRKFVEERGMMERKSLEEVSPVAFHRLTEVVLSPTKRWLIGSPKSEYYRPGVSSWLKGRFYRPSCLTAHRLTHAPLLAIDCEPRLEDDCVVRRAGKPMAIVYDKFENASAFVRRLSGRCSMDWPARADRLPEAYEQLLDRMREAANESQRNCPLPHYRLWECSKVWDDIKEIPSRSMGYAESQRADGYPYVFCEARFELSLETDGGAMVKLSFKSFRAEGGEGAYRLFLGSATSMHAFSYERLYQ